MAPLIFFLLLFSPPRLPALLDEEEENEEDIYTPVPTPRNDLFDHGEQSKAANAAEEALEHDEQKTKPLRSVDRFERIVAEPQLNRMPSFSCLKGSERSQSYKLRQRQHHSRSLPKSRTVTFGGKVKCRLITPLDPDLKLQLFYTAAEIDQFEVDAAKEDARQSVQEASQRVLAHSSLSSRSAAGGSAAADGNNGAGDIEFGGGALDDEEDEMYAF